MLYSVLIMVSTNYVWSCMNEKDGGVAGSPCLLSTLGAECLQEGISLVPLSR